MCGTKLGDKLPCIELRQRLAIEGWSKDTDCDGIKHLSRKDDNDWLKEMSYFGGNQTKRYAQEHMERVCG